MIDNHWSSRTTFLMASIGVAVGLGNIWRFPYVVGTSGGGVFVLIYVATILVFAVPVLIAELMIGRRGQHNPVDAIKTVCQQEGRRPGLWNSIGFFSMAVPFISLAYYSVVAGWTLDYFIKSLSGAFSNVDSQQSAQIFDSLLASEPMVLLWHALIIAITAVIISRGLKAGLEKSIKILMPGLTLILIILVISAAILGDFRMGMEFLFRPDFSKLSAETVLMAMGQGFFSLGIGAGSIMAYGAYMKQDISIPRMSLIIASADTLVALMAGLIIFPFVFAFGLEPDSGPGLIFVTLPIAFGKIPLGSVLAAMFFLLLAAASLTTMLSMLECMTRLFEERFAWRRRTIVTLIAGASWCLGVLAVLSFNVLSDVFPLEMFTFFEGKTFFDLMDYSVANILIPFNGLLIVVFAGWAVSKKTTLMEFGDLSQSWYQVWRFIVRYVAPIGISTIFVLGLF